MQTTIVKARRFLILDEEYTLAEMLEVNYHDEEFCDWARTAKNGDVWPGIGERCECLS